MIFFFFNLDVEKAFLTISQIQMFKKRKRKRKIWPKNLKIILHGKKIPKQSQKNQMHARKKHI